MTRDDDFIGQLEGYLDEFEGLTPLPDAVRDAVHAQLPTTRQVGSLPGRMRHPRTTMSIPSLARYALAAAIVVAAVALGASFFGRGVGGPNATPLPMATPGELPIRAPLQPGAYFVVNPCNSPCADYRWITFTVPAGWTTTDGLVGKHLGQPNEVAFSVWTPGDVYLDPCHWQESSTGSIGHTHSQDGAIVLDDQYALLNQAGTSASVPTQLRLGGQAAMRIELTISADLDIAACDNGEYRTWTEAGSSSDRANSHHTAGQIDVVYFVDVDRNPLFIDASHRPGASQEDLAELQAILDSMIVDRG